MLCAGEIASSRKLHSPATAAASCCDVFNLKRIMRWIRTTTDYGMAALRSHSSLSMRRSLF
jgi:hypothetical protein